MSFGLQFGSAFDHGHGGFNHHMAINPALTPVGALLYNQAAAQPVFQQQPHHQFAYPNPVYGQQAMMQQQFMAEAAGPPSYNAVMHQQQPIHQPSFQQPPYPQPLMQQPPFPPPIIMQPGAPIEQPQQEKWMQMPEASDPNCPFGLQFLLNLDTVNKMELVEVVTTIEVPNRYSIQNNAGEQIYYAIESNDFLAQQMMGSKRNFYFKIVDNLNRHIFTVRRDQFECCTSECAVEAPPGQKAGYINNTFACCKSKIVIADEKKSILFTIDGPCYCKGTCCCVDKEYPLMSGPSQIGSIVRKYPGYLQDTYSRADNFEVKFPVDLAVRMKAVLIGTAIFLDFLEFEQRNQPQNRRQGMQQGMHQGMHHH